MEEDHNIDEEFDNEMYFNFLEISHESFQKTDILSNDQEEELVPENNVKYFSTQKDDRVVDKIIENPNGLDSTEEGYEDTQLESLKIILKDLQEENEIKLHSEKLLEIIDPYQE